MTQQDAHRPGRARRARGVRRVVVRTLVTLAVAAAVCWWAARGVAWSDVRASLRSVDVGLLAGCAAVFALSFGTTDVLAFGLAWRRHLDPGVPWRDVRTLVLGKQVLFTTVPLATKTVPPAYFWRRRGLPLGRVVGASELVSAAETVVVLVLVTVTAVAGAVDLGAGFLVGLAAAWVLLLGGLAWLRAPARGTPSAADAGPSRSERVRGSGLLRAFASATPREAATQLGLRLAHQLVAVGCLAVLLHGWGVALGPAELLTFGPLFLFSGFLPVSVAGYGGPQGIAVALLADRWGLLAPADALAFSVAWSAALLATQLLVGLVHLPRLVPLVTGPRRAAPDDPADARPAPVPARAATLPPRPVPSATPEGP